MSTVRENLQSASEGTTSDLGRIISSVNVRNFLGLCLFGTAYYFAYYYGMSFSQTAGSPFWFPDSVLLCALLVTRPRHWAIFIAATLVIRLVVPLNVDIPTWFKLATFAIDAAKGLLVATALRRFIRDPLRLQTIQDYAVYCLFAVLLVPAANAFAGAWARQSFGFHYWIAWEQWFMGDALTNLIVTPALLFLVSGAWKIRPRFSGRQRLEAGLLVVGLIATGWIAFHTGSVRIGLDETRFYAPIPFLFWAAIRFGMFGACGAITIIAFLAVEAAISGQGLFAGLSPDETAQSLQNFLLLRAAPLYLFAILVEERKSDERSMGELRQGLAHAGRVTMLGQLSSSLAHELNQPLAAILRNAEAAEIFLESDSPNLEELRAIITDIRKDDQRAGGVIDRLRALLQRGQLDLRSLSLGEVIEEVVTLIYADSATRHVGIEIDAPNELPPVCGDRIHLQQVLLNLLINGMDALTDVADGSRILMVRARQNNEGLVQVAVSDNGQGIPPEKLQHLFEAFFTTKPQGMGLGLAICKTIIDAHGGRLWAENNPERGATFRFTVPIAKGDVA